MTRDVYDSKILGGSGYAVRDCDLTVPEAVAVILSRLPYSGQSRTILAH